MGVSGFVALVVLSRSLSVIPRTQQLQASETQVLLQLRKHLEYPPRIGCLGELHRRNLKHSSQGSSRERRKMNSAGGNKKNEGGD
ncbi:hypothetical protein CDL15_Pgr007919 [Punica granatum]|uniref:Secreted protein n=1 Tax=Punica granatum TaxID=22663 RepID=A0A218XBJ2_PUNGR|nr:hypothetical protein CDL15_Pgr007919 [Punica granatum]PKI65961.1 hypothetical protein CRG98_013627 [Punica granatum]